MNIINSDIVSREYDIFWEDITIPAAVPGRQVLVIVSECAAGSPDDQQLQKMLVAGKLAPEDMNIIRIGHGDRLPWHRLRELLDPAAIFLVGVMPAQLGISAMFRLNEPNSFNDKTWLPTLSIAELERNPEVKKQLWTNGVKPLFADKER